nr:MAG TPA: chitin synthase regulator [Microviridae sp.]
MSDLIPMLLAFLIVFGTLAFFYLLLIYPSVKRRLRLEDSLTHFLESHSNENSEKIDKNVK